MHVPAAAAAGTALGAGGTAAWLFDYNRANFQFDAPRRFERFLAARGFANSQTAQYREDVHGFMETTVSKMEATQCVLTLFLCICAALSCAGRIGMHGAAPPSWLCALYSGHIFTALLYCGTALWLCFHASLRAQCAGVSLLTRKVRLPIPNMAQLDAARNFGCGFEKQTWRDIVRVPFMRHPEWAPEIPPASDGDSEDGLKSNKPKEKRAKGGGDDPRAGFDSTARDTVPTWIRDEQVVDKGEGFPAERLPEPPLYIEHDAPEHFKLLQQAQEHWYQYDVYARIMMLFGVCNFLHAVSYYSIGTTISELRGFWIMWSLPLTFMTAQALIMRLDIVRQYTGHHMVPHLEWAGHLAPFISIAACTLDFRYTFSRSAVICTWVLVQLAYFCHLLMALRMLDLAWPDLERDDELPDEPGKAWWPKKWKVPSAFARALWIIAPPNKLEVGQHDLLNEMRTLSHAGGGVTASDADSYLPEKGIPLTDETTDYAGGVKAFGSKRPGDLPWRVSRMAIMTVGFIWAYMMVANFVEMFIGPEAMMKPPGEPPWIRDQKLRSWTPDMWHVSTGEIPEDYRLFAPSTARYDGDSPGWSPPGHPDLAAPSHGAHEADSHHEVDEDETDEEPAPTNNTHRERHQDSHHDHGHGRRLGNAPLGDLLKLLPALDKLVEKLDAGDFRPKAAEPPQLPQIPFMAPAPKVQLAWPAFFEPQFLACSGGASVALTSRGFGTLQTEGQSGEAFALQGLVARTPIVGSTWTGSGLQLVTRNGSFVTCPGAPVDGVWRCVPAAMPALELPQGSGLLSAAVSEDGLVAMQLETMPGSVALFRRGNSGWSPAGLVHLPPGVHFQGRLGLALTTGELLVIASNGDILRRRLSDARTSVLPPKVGALGREFRASCVQSDGSLLRLAIRSGEAGVARTPELLA